MKYLLVICTIMLALSVQAEPAGRYQAPRSAVLRLDQGAAGKGGAQVKQQGNIWQWTLSADQNLATLSFDLDKAGINPEFYDEIQIRFRSMKSLVMMLAEVQDYPVTDLRRSWYSKIAIQPEAWNDWRLDMKLDDDSMQEYPIKSSGRKLNISVQKRYLRIPGEPPEREVEIAEVRFLRRPVELNFDELQAKMTREKSEIRWTYELELFNKELTPRTVELKLDSTKLKHFKPSWQENKIVLQPRERRTVPLSLAIAESAAAKQPVLYSESVLVRMACPELKELPEFYPVMGYRPRLIWAVVPPAEVKDFFSAPPKDRQAKVIAGADKALGQSWGVPEFGPARHPSAYLDKEGSSKLETLSWYRHRSIKTGRLIENDMEINRGNITNIHGGNFKRALLLGQAWRLTGDVAYAEAARDVFLEYVRVYPSLAVTSISATGYRSRLGLNTLMTAFWFHTALEAYDAIRTSAALNDADRQEIEDRFLAPELAALYGHNIEFTNMQVHHYQVYAYGAAVLRRHWNLLGEALYGDHGFYAMVEHSFSEDGMSQEGNVYHIFALRPLLDFAKEMRALGIEVMNQRFKRVFDGAVENSPDGIVRSQGMAGCLLEAWQVYRDVRYLPTLRYHKLVDEPGGGLLTESSVQPNNGFLWLREKSGYGFRAVSLNYIMALDRMEYDRLHFNLYDPGQLCTEVWRLNYGAKNGDVMYKTVSHNTVTVDRGDQADVAAQMIAFLKRPHMPGALFTEVAEAPLYEGVRFSRAAAIFDGIMFIGDLQQGSATHVYDWPLYGLWEPWAHQEVGRFRLPFELKTADTGYKFMSDARSADAEQGFSAVCGATAFDKGGQRIGRTAPDRWLRATFAGAPAQEVFSANTPRGHMPEPGPLLMLRQQGKEAVFAAAFEVVPQADAPGRVKMVETVWRDGVSGAWKITADSGMYLVIVNRTGKTVEVNGIKTEQKLEVIKL